MAGQPSASAPYADPLLTQVAISHVSPFDILGQAIPTVQTAKKSGKIPIFGSTDFQRAQASNRDEEGAFHRIGYGLTQQDFDCVNKGVEITVSDDLRDNWEIGSSADIVATRLAMDAHTMKRQVDIATGITGATWTGTENLASGSNTQWDESAEDALGDIDDASQGVLDRIGADPNTMILAAKHFRYLRKAPTIKALISGGATPQNPAIATKMVLQQIFPHLQNIVVVPNVRVTSKEGATTTTRSNVWGNYCWIGWVAPRPEFGSPSACYVLRWKTPRVVTYREQQHTRDVIQGQESYVFAQTMADAGHLISNVLNSF